ncbi:hypothetical protein Aduo_016601 [Ancylostoma duodenale]
MVFQTIVARNAACAAQLGFLPNLEAITKIGSKALIQKLPYVPARLILSSSPAFALLRSYYAAMAVGDRRRQVSLDNMRMVVLCLRCGGRYG